MRSRRAAWCGGLAITVLASGAAAAFQDSPEDAWAEAIDELFLDERFEDLELEPVDGLVPLGPDPDSGLWEFWHVPSGARPDRDPGTGRWRITAETGLVLVLVPGGAFTMGAESPDAAHEVGDPHVDPLSLYFFRPAHEVTLGAYFLSKYEMTQAQWQRVTGDNPAQTRPVPPLEFSIVKPTNPVETVSHDECAEVLERLGLTLPTEAQWERACRADTTTVYSTGDEPLSLHGFANVMDASHPDRSRQKTAFDDGFVDHAPVGSYRPNAFGLHDMHGNLAEWCREARHHYTSVAARPGDGERVPGADHQCSGDKVRVIRGGSFWDAAERATCAERWGASPRARSWSVGVRPALSID